MKKNVYVILGGVAALHALVFGGLFVTGGCKNVVMDERQYTPAEEENKTQQETATENETTAPAVEETEKAPAATTAEPAAKPTRESAPKAPRFQPMNNVKSSGGVSHAAGATAKAQNGTYVVKPGDTIGRIANANGVSIGAVLKANNLTLESAKRIRPGQKLVIPGKGAAAVKENKATAKSSKSAKSGKSVKTADSSVNTALLNADGTYTVKSGDNIPKIARKLGVKSLELQRYNNLSDEATRRLRVGQKLAVPGKGTAADVQAPTQAVAADDINALINDAQTAKPATNVNPMPTTDAAAPAPVAVAAETAVQAEVVSGASTPIEVVEAITIDEFAKRNNTTADVLRKLNSELPADGKLQTGTIIFVPAAK